MISKKDLEEVKNRDFLKRVDHYNDLNSIGTKLVYGKHYNGEVFLNIILPVYDHPKEFIERAIDSALRQKCSFSYQIIVIDDYPSDEPTTTEQYIRELNDSRVIYYKNETNMGVFGNWNRAILLARSKWVCFLHSDDFFRDNYLQNMYDIIQTHPQIDQLACTYKKLDFLHDNINIKKERAGFSCKSILRKVKYTEYLYEMKTSVKGAFYQKDKLVEIGGFRSQGDGIGLDDYPLMMRYAYYYNTYLVECDLYLNSWAYNDSLNTKHWYPELVENYYMWLYFANKERKFVKFFYKYTAKYLLLERAKLYQSGRSWVGVPIEIDFKQLEKDCQLNNIKINRVLEAVSFGVVFVLQKYRNRIENKEVVYIKKD